MPFFFGRLDERVGDIFHRAIELAFFKAFFFWQA
jgi:hypothetical protein